MGERLGQSQELCDCGSVAVACGHVRPRSDVGGR